MESDVAPFKVLGTLLKRTEPECLCVNESRLVLFFFSKWMKKWRQFFKPIMKRGAEQST